MLRIKKHTRELFRKIFENLKPPADISISEWADRYRKLSPESSALPGQWHTISYQKEIMDSINNLSVEKTVVMSSAQIGKTDAFILNAIAYYMVHEPSPIMVMQPTLTMGETFSKDRLGPMLRDTPALKGVVDEGKRSGSTILHKVFPGGHITIVGSNSPQSLASRPIRILLADEIDRYPVTAGKEGDPLALAAKRQTTYWNRREINISTPTIANLSRIELEYKHSSKGEWNVPCPSCGEYQPLVWDNVKYDDENLGKIEYVCQSCGAIHSEYEWKELFNDGKYIHEFPDCKIKGFHLNSLASPFVEWHDIVEKYIKAKEEEKKGNCELIKTFVNTEQGLPYEEPGEVIEYANLLERCEEYEAEVPTEVICLTAGIDTQDDRFEVEVVGWGEEKESWGIKYARIYGDLEREEIWNELDIFLSQSFMKADGTKLNIICACIDSGGHFTNEVYKFCKTKVSRRIFAIKGSNNATAPFISQPSRNNREKTPLFTIGVDTGKALMNSRLKLETPGAGYCHFPSNGDRGYDETYFKYLTAEKMVVKYKNGRAVFTWILKDSNQKRNEPWDVRNYATAALEIASPTLKKSAENYKKHKKSTGRRQRGQGY